jgi:hypothetical protein
VSGNPCGDCNHGRGVTPRERPPALIAPGRERALKRAVTRCADRGRIRRSPAHRSVNVLEYVGLDTTRVKAQYEMVRRAIERDDFRQATGRRQSTRPRARRVHCELAKEQWPNRRTPECKEHRARARRLHRLELASRSRRNAASVRKYSGRGAGPIPAVVGVDALAVRPTDMFSRRQTKISKLFGTVEASPPTTTRSSDDGRERPRRHLSLGARASACATLR